jgi:hypothetical protein
MRLPELSQRLKPGVVGGTELSGLKPGPILETL